MERYAALMPANPQLQLQAEIEDALIDQACQDEFGHLLF
jgi:hypothetical protein